jgi:hypothetical protein
MSFKTTLASLLKTNDFRTLELEFRVGFQTSTGYHARVPKLVWMTAKNKLQDGVEVMTIDKYVKSRQNESSRHVQTPRESFWEHKKKVDMDITPGKYAIRSSLAIEIREEGSPPNSFVLQRKKHRTSFAKGPWSLDFTRVEAIPSDDKDNEETYEIEVELKDIGYLFEKELDLVIQEGIHIAQSLVST